MSELPYSLSLRMNPIKGLSLEARFHGMYTSYDMPDTKVRFNWNSVDISASYMVRDFQFMAQCASPRKSLDGVSTLHTGWSFSTSALWRKRNFYVSLEYSYNQDSNWSLIEVPGFCSMDKSSFGSMGYRLQLSAGYSFQIGKRYYVRKDRNLKNAATETGYAAE